MNTEIFLENNRVDISADLSSLITHAIDDIADFSSRQTSFSKTIILPGTANNNRLFGNIFQAGQSNDYDSTAANFGYNFNASKSAGCIIFQDNIQTFKGVLRLLQINITDGRPEYEVAVFGDLLALNTALTSGLLEQLDFSTYDHVYNETNIVASWDNTPGSGYFYPLMDYGNYSVAKHDWDIRTFRPALYVKEYIDKMFAAANFRYSSAIFNTTRFKKLVIPQNKKVLQRLVAAQFEALRTTPYTIISTASGISDALVSFPTFFTGTAFTINGGNDAITYTGLTTNSFNKHLLITGEYSSPNVAINIYIVKNGTTIIGAAELPNLSSPTSYTRVVDLTNVSLSTGDVLTIRVVNQVPGGGTYTVSVGTCDFTAVGTSGSVYAPIEPGDTVQVNDSIPKNIRQVDFLVSILKLFNLYVIEDKFDSRLVYITPYVDFYGTDNTESVDWTYKLNRNKPIVLKPMSELNAKIYNFKLKQDSDYYNSLYSKRYGQDYGSYIYDTLYEFTAESNSFELIFSPTPIVGYSGEDKVFSTIQKVNNPDDPAKRTEETIDSNIRILQTKKITGISSWDILDGVTTLASSVNYGYAGHFDDPDAPANDLNFGALQELFFVLASGDLSNTQFNVYWSSYMAEITDKDSKLLTASFYLKPSDIFDLDFSKYIYVDGVLFRLNKITDYNMSMPGDCQVELLKVNFTNY